MPPALVIRVVGDVAGLEKSFRRASADTEKFSKDVGRNAASISVAFRGIAKSVALATGGFAAVDFGLSFLKASVNEARDAEKAQKSLAAQMKASGESFRQNRIRIEQASMSYARFGIDNDDVVKSLTVLERATGNVNHAIGLQGAVVNIAKAKNIELAAAAGIVAKAVAGQDTSLRRAVPGLDKNAHGLDLVREAGERLAGQAAANTTASDRFGASLKNLEETVGVALLPTLDHALDSLSKWLDRMSRSGELQRDVNAAMKDGQQAFATAKAVVTPLADAFKTLGDAVGGTRNELELLAASFAAFKLTGLLGGLGLIGSTAGRSTAEVTALRFALTRLGAIGVITTAIEIVVHRKQIEGAVRSAVQASTTRGAPSPFGLPFSRDPLDTRPNTSGRVPAGHFNFAGGPDVQTFDKLGRIIERLTIPKGGGGSFFTHAPALTAQQQLQLGLAANPDSLKLLQQQASRDRAAIAFAERLRNRGTINNAKYVSEVAGYQSDLQSTLGRIASITTDAAEKLRASQQKLRAAAVKAAAAGRAESAAGGRLGTVGASIFAGLPGLGFHTGANVVRGFTEPLALQVKLLDAQAFKHTSAIAGILKKERVLAVKAYHSNRSSLTAQADALQAIIDINNQLGGKVKGDVTAFRHVSSLKLAQGLGLQGDALRAARVGFAVSVPQPSQAFAGAGGGGIQFNGPTTIINQGVENMAQLEDQLEKRARSRPQIRRGAR